MRGNIFFCNVKGKATCAINWEYTRNIINVPITIITKLAFGVFEIL